jgi:FkbM family methyltransferase
MINEFKNLIKGKKKEFLRVCASNNLRLDYGCNKNTLGILKDIFEHREYSDYFPFYKKVNIIDIGAHYGYFSIFASKNSDESSRIISIEPNKSNFKNLQKNIKDSQISNISSFNLAVGGETGLSKLYLGQSPNHSIIENYALLDQNERFEEIEVKTLEELIIENDLDPIDFLKMDCEGAEYAILEITPRYIFDKITTISMEFHDLKDSRFTGETLIMKLMGNGFDIVKYKYDKTSMNLNYGKIIATKTLKTLGTQRS